MHTFGIHVTRASQGIVIRLRDEVHAKEIPSLENELHKVIAERPQQVTLDLHDLTFIASLGLGALVSLHNALEESGGTLRIIGAQPRIIETIHRARLHTVLQCEPAQPAS